MHLPRATSAWPGGGDRAGETQGESVLATAGDGARCRYRGHAQADEEIYLQTANKLTPI